MPTVGSTGSLSNFGSVTVGAVSSTQTFTVTGSDLVGDLSVAAPSTDFQVSNDGSTWGSSALFGFGDPTVNATCYVRFTPQSAGAKSGNLTISSTGATSATKAVAGTGVAPVGHPTMRRWGGIPGMNGNPIFGRGW